MEPAAVPGPPAEWLTVDDKCGKARHRPGGSRWAARSILISVFVVVDWMMALQAGRRPA
jgi:hypothetical protein